MPTLKDLYRVGGALTWFNHYSVLKCKSMGVRPDDFDAIGFDGQFLRKLLNLQNRPSSADIDLPALLLSESPKVGLIGGHASSYKEHERYFSEAFPNCNVLWNFDGFGESETEEAANTIINLRPDLILIGMGPGRQEIEALRLHQILSSRPGTTLIATCGGWLDQLGYVDYYPRAAKSLNLRWLFRLVREPVRLWKRYTLYALQALMNRRSISTYCSGIRPLEF
jgi:exopolysaccharide biosynthesis WecB/TagA/CpsF family protein